MTMGKSPYMFRTDAGFSEFTILTPENIWTQRASCTIPESERHHGTPKLKALTVC